jgi:hypothetical protein
MEDLPGGLDNELVDKGFSNAIRLVYSGDELLADVFLLFAFVSFFFSEFGAFGGDFVLNFFDFYRGLSSGTAA